MVMVGRFSASWLMILVFFMRIVSLKSSHTVYNMCALIIVHIYTFRHKIILKCTYLPLSNDKQSSLSWTPQFYGKVKMYLIFFVFAVIHTVWQSYDKFDKWICKQWLFTSCMLVYIYWFDDLDQYYYLWWYLIQWSW